MHHLPKITHLHALVLRLLQQGALASSELRRALGRHGVTKSGAAFCELMGRMVESGWIDDEPIHTGGIEGSRREYSITSAGRKALETAADFYAAVDGVRRAAA